MYGLVHGMPSRIYSIFQKLINNNNNNKNQNFIKINGAVDNVTEEIKEKLKQKLKTIYYFVAVNGKKKKIENKTRNVSQPK